MQSVQAFGPSCHLPGSFQGTIVVLAIAHSFEDAVRANIMAGGDQAGRSHAVGAMLAAQGGMFSVPESWRHRVTRMAELEALVDLLLSQRSG